MLQEITDYFPIATSENLRAIDAERLKQLKATMQTLITLPRKQRLSFEEEFLTIESQLGKLTGRVDLSYRTKFYGQIKDYSGF